MGDRLKNRKTNDKLKYDPSWFSITLIRVNTE